MPLAGRIRRALHEHSAHRAPASRLRDELGDHMSEQFAEHSLCAVSSCGRYAEAFAFACNEATGVFSLDDPA